MVHDPTQLPANLPRPADDGAAGHLPGMTMPAISLPSTTGDLVRVDVVPGGFSRFIIYAYPMTGVPGVDLPPGWDDIPGARGCTPESCGFRDHAAELAALGATVAGLATQSTAYQREVTERLHLPFPLLSDSELTLTNELRLPFFTIETGERHDGAGVKTLLKRLTLVVRDGTIEKVFYPIFPPDQHAAEVLAWLEANPAG
jgi:peroxiredoxin